MAQHERDIGWRSAAVRRSGVAWSGCQVGMRADGLSARAARVFQAAMVPVMRAAVAVHFRRVQVLHGERVPPEGAVLLLANHPSTWTDVLLLDAALGRRFHFLAQEEQFHPWPRMALLRLYGTLPLSSREHRADAMERNAATFQRCEALFDRGEGVAAFPEGISLVDRGLLPLKHGAARLALSYASRRAGRSLSLVPVGLHYSDRTAFRSDVTVSVGEAIPAGEWLSPQAGDREAAASRLTERMAGAIGALVLESGDHRHERVFSALEPLAAGDAGSLELETARRLAQALAGWRRSRPADFARLEREAHVLERTSRALGVSVPALGERSRADPAGAQLALLVGAVPALAGLAVHALPALLTRAATRRYASEPSQVAFARIASGFLFFGSAYGAGIALLLAVARVHASLLLLLVPLSVLLGAITLSYAERLRCEYERARLACLSRRHGRLVLRARRARAFLLGQLDRLRS